MAANMSAQPNAREYGALSASNISRDEGAVPGIAAEQSADSAVPLGSITSSIHATALMNSMGALICKRSRAAGVIGGPPVSDLGGKY
jgi:hypothetical protein